MSLHKFLRVIDRVSEAAQQLTKADDPDGAIGQQEALAAFRLELAKLRMRAADIIDTNTHLNSDLQDIRKGLLLPCLMPLRQPSAYKLSGEGSREPGLFGDEPHMMTREFECDDCGFREHHWINQARDYLMRSSLGYRHEIEEAEESARVREERAKAKQAKRENAQTAETQV
jgi:hypothetical protein